MKFGKEIGSSFGNNTTMSQISADGLHMVNECE